MPDPTPAPTAPPPSQPAATPAAPAPAPTPAPTAPPVAAAAPAQEPPPLTRESAIAMQGTNGETLNVTMGQLADAYRNQPDPELLKQVQLQQKVQAGDPEAIQEYVKGLVPTPAAPAGEPSEIEQMRDEVKGLRELVQNRISPIVDQVSAANDQRVIAAVIETQKENAPLLQKHPNATALVQARWQHYHQLAKQAGQNLDQLPMDVRANVLKRSIAEAEAFVKTTLDAYGVQTGTMAAAPAGSNIVSVNDQVPGESRPGVRPAVWRDQLLDPTRPETMAPMPPQPAQPPAPLSSQPVPPVPTGAAVGIQGETPVAGPMTSEAFRQRLRARTEKV